MGRRLNEPRIGAWFKVRVAADTCTLVVALGNLANGLGLVFFSQRTSPFLNTHHFVL